MLPKTLYLGKKKHPKSEKDLGYILEFDTSETNFLVPKNYDSREGTGFDIALIKIPELEQDALLDYLYLQDEKPKVDEDAIKRLKSTKNFEL